MNSQTTHHWMPLSVVFVLSVRRYLLKRFTSLQDPVLQRQVIAHICARLSLQSWRKWGVRNLQRVIFKIKCAHRQCLWLHIIYPWETARATERERERALYFCHPPPVCEIRMQVSWDQFTIPNYTPACTLLWAQIQSILMHTHREIPSHWGPDSWSFEYKSIRQLHRIVSFPAIIHKNRHANPGNHVHENEVIMSRVCHVNWSYWSYLR